MKPARTLMEALANGEQLLPGAGQPLNFCKRPCANCPWRTDAVPLEFDTQAFRRLADTAYDNSMVYFQCHKSSDESPLVCAGFLLRGAAHNFAVRLDYVSGRIKPGAVDDAGLALHPNYRAMAEANGVDPDDPILIPCREN